MKFLTLVFILFWIFTSQVQAKNEIPRNDLGYYVTIMYDPHKSPVVLEREFVYEMVGVAQCESGWNDNKIGLLREQGILQIHPAHIKEMKELGLDFYNGRDRLIFAQYLWHKHGWLKDWVVCGKHAAPKNQ